MGEAEEVVGLANRVVAADRPNLGQTGTLEQARQPVPDPARLLDAGGGSLEDRVGQALVETRRDQTPARLAYDHPPDTPRHADHLRERPVRLVGVLKRPIRALASRAEQLAVRYTGHAVQRSRNEMQDLVVSFEAMTGALLAQIERLKGLHLEELQNSLELQRRYALMRLLRNLSTAALECEHHEQLLERAVEELGGYLDWPIGRVLIVADGSERSVWFVGQADRFAAFIAASEGLGGERCPHGLIGLAGATGMPHWATDLDRLRQWQRHEVAVQSGLKSGFAIPIPGDGSTHAFLEFFADHRVEASAEMVELIDAIHTELWQAGQRRKERLRQGLAAARSAAADRPRQLDALGAASR